MTRRWAAAAISAWTIVVLHSVGDRPGSSRANPGTCHGVARAGDAFRNRHP